MRVVAVNCMRKTMIHFVFLILKVHMTTLLNCLMQGLTRVWWTWTMASLWKVFFFILQKDFWSLQVLSVPSLSALLPSLSIYIMLSSSIAITSLMPYLLSISGGRYVKVWDLLKGGQPLVSLKNHHKTVTSLCLGSNGQRLLSASLDRCVLDRFLYNIPFLK